MNKLNLWKYVPSLYFAEGFVYVIVNSLSVIIYKNLGVDNALIGMYTSLLYLPWTIKMFWSPFVDIFYTKRFWLIKMQLLISVFLAVSGAVLLTGHFFYLSLFCFALAAFASATNDIATDGYYMLVFKKEDQEKFIGIRVLFYRLAIIFAMSFLVYFSGFLQKNFGSFKLAWSTILLLCGFVYFVFHFYHKDNLPPEEETKIKHLSPWPDIKEAAVSYFTQEKIVIVLLFILLYRFGEGMLMKMSVPFFLDGQAVGGLGLLNEQVGYLYGGVGTLSLIGGGVLGGWLISKFGFSKCIWPMTIALNFPNLFYYYLAAAKPALWLVYPLVALEQFGAGLGFMAFTVFLMDRCDPRFKTTHFAVSTGLMGLGLMLPGMLSGILQKTLGYGNFFIFAFLVTVPAMLLIAFLPKPRQ